MRRALLTTGVMATLILSACAPAAPTTVAPPTAAPLRLVKHAMGETMVPSSPQRVVTLDLGELESVMALGMKPVGAATQASGEFAAHLGATDGITRVGVLTQPNLEAIAALRPDLILGSKLRLEKVYAQLAQIAPTVFTETVGVTWRENLLVYGDALGKRAEAEKLLTSYRGRAGELKTRLGDQLSKTEVSVLTGRPTEVRIIMKSGFVGTILDDVGLPRPAAQTKNVPFETGGVERIADMDGDVIFYTFNQNQRAGLLADIMNDAPWKSLKAVKAGKAFEVDDTIWIAGVGILGADRVLDDLFKNLAK